jgi:hypothetical protein
VPSAAGDLPTINNLVRVTLGDLDDPEAEGFASDVSSRIQDLTTDKKTGRVLSYLIAAPVFAGDLETPRTGTTCLLQWATTEGICTLPTAFEARELIGNNLRVWRLKVTGPPRRDQRRRYFRVQSAIPTQLAIRRDLEELDPERLRTLEFSGVLEKLETLPESLAAVSLNISEGGLRCMTPEPVLPADLPLITRFTLGTTWFVIPAHVIWSELRQHEGKQLVESALEFDDPGAQGDVLRPLLFEVQLKARRAGLQ